MAWISSSAGRDILAVMTMFNSSQSESLGTGTLTRRPTSRPVRYRSLGESRTSSLNTGPMPGPTFFKPVPSPLELRMNACTCTLILTGKSTKLLKLDVAHEFTVVEEHEWLRNDLRDLLTSPWRGQVGEFKLLLQTEGVDGVGWAATDVGVEI